MPIYAYRCEACSFAKDVLQKMSEDTLTICPSCGKDAYRKQVTAAGFQLKGSGWYVTDFRNGSGGAAKTAPGTVAGEGSKDNGNKDNGSKEGGKDGGNASGDSAAAAPAAAAPSTTGSATPATPAAASSSKPAA